MADEQAVVERRGREGGRWVNERPTPEEFAQWFKDSMTIDPALKVEDYIGGVVLIPAVEKKAKYVTGFRNGVPLIVEREELSYVPYAKVESRIDYFWDLMEAHEETRVGVVERQTPARLPVEEILVRETTDAEGNSTNEYGRPGGLASMVHQLPDGFSVMSVPVGEGYSHFLCCTIKVAIYRREDLEKAGRNPLPLREGIGTKQVPLTRSFNSRVWADESSLMKAETGALGRALGFAGIFVIPGSGIATAEDMLEASADGVPATQTATPAQGPEAPAEAPIRTGAERAVDDEAQMKERALELFKTLREDFPERAEEFTTWAHERNLKSLNEATGAHLRGVVRKLERLIDAPQAEPTASADGQ